MRSTLLILAMGALAAGIGVSLRKPEASRGFPEPPVIRKVGERANDAGFTRPRTGSVDVRDEIAELVATDPATALKNAAGIEDVAARGDAVGFVLAQRAANEADAVFAWLEDNGEPPEVVSAVERKVLPALADGDPSRVAAWIAGGRVTPANVASAVATTVQRWAQQEPSAASDWVAGFGDDLLLRAAMEPLVSIWASSDSEAVVGWIDSLPPGIARDEACAAYAAHLAPRCPEDAGRWAAEIGSPRLLSETLRRIGAE